LPPDFKITLGCFLALFLERVEYIDTLLEPHYIKDAKGVATPNPNFIAARSH
jgi:hypothetical protein